MTLTWEKVSEVYLSILTGSRTFGEAHDWAWSVMRADDLGDVEYDPASQNGELFKAITYLTGVDIEVRPGEFLHGLEDVREAYQKLCVDARKS